MRCAVTSLLLLSSICALITCWSDRLIIADELKCIPKHELIEAANKACGQNVSDFTFGGEGACKRGSYSEITFECDLERETHIYPSAAYFEEYYRELQVYALKQLVSFASTRNSESPVYNRTFFLETKYRCASEVVQRIVTFAGYYEMNSSPTFEVFQPFPNKTFISLNAEISSAKLDIQRRNKDRIDSIISTIGQILLNEPVEIGGSDLQKFNVENYFNESIPLYRRFPELRIEMESFVVDYLRNHTLGIDRRHLGYLNESNAHEKLISQYKEILKPGYVSFKYLDAQEKDFVLSGEAQNVVWSDRLTANGECLPSSELMKIANGLCQRDTDQRLLIHDHNGSFVVNTSLVYPGAISLELKEPCDASNDTFRELALECRFPREFVQRPPKELGEKLFHRVYLSLLRQYADLARKYFQAQREGDEERIARLHHSLQTACNPPIAYGNHFDLGVETVGSEYFADMYANPIFYLTIDFANETGTEAIVGSRENAVGSLCDRSHRTFLRERPAILFAWALKLLRNESIEAEEMAEFNVENFVAKYGDSNAVLEPYADREDLRRRFEKCVVEYCRDHTPVVGAEHLEFLNEANAHLKLAALYRKIFTPGSVDLSFANLLYTL